MIFAEAIGVNFLPIWNNRKGSTSEMPPATDAISKPTKKRPAWPLFRKRRERMGSARGGDT
jgi:hypothetical protein